MTFDGNFGSDHYPQVNDAYPQVPSYPQQTGISPQVQDGSPQPEPNPSTHPHLFGITRVGPPTNAAPLYAPRHAAEEPRSATIPPVPPQRTPDPEPLFNEPVAQFDGGVWITVGLAVVVIVLITLGAVFSDHIFKPF